MCLEWGSKIWMTDTAWSVWLPCLVICKLRYEYFSFIIWKLNYVKLRSKYLYIYTFGFTNNLICLNSTCHSCLWQGVRHRDARSLHKQESCMTAIPVCLWKCPTYFSNYWNSVAMKTAQTSPDDCAAVVKSWPHTASQNVGFTFLRNVAVTDIFYE